MSDLGQAQWGFEGEYFYYPNGDTEINAYNDYGLLIGSGVEAYAVGFSSPDDHLIWYHHCLMPSATDYLFEHITHGYASGGEDVLWEFAEPHGRQSVCSFADSDGNSIEFFYDPDTPEFIVDQDEREYTKVTHMDNL